MGLCLVSNASVEGVHTTCPWFPKVVSGQFFFYSFSATRTRAVFNWVCNWHRFGIPHVCRTAGSPSAAFVGNRRPSAPTRSPTPSRTTSRSSSKMLDQCPTPTPPHPPPPTGSLSSSHYCAQSSLYFLSAFGVSSLWDQNGNFYEFFVYFFFHRASHSWVVFALDALSFWAESSRPRKPCFCLLLLPFFPVSSGTTPKTELNQKVVYLLKQ